MGTYVLLALSLLGVAVFGAISHRMNIIEKAEKSFKEGLSNNKSWEELKKGTGFSKLSPKYIYGELLNTRPETEEKFLPLLQSAIKDEKLGVHAPAMLAHANSPKQFAAILEHPNADINQLVDGRNILEHVYQHIPDDGSLLTFQSTTTKAKKSNINYILDNPNFKHDTTLANNKNLRQHFQEIRSSYQESAASLEKKSEDLYDEMSKMKAPEIIESPDYTKESYYIKKAEAERLASQASNVELLEHILKHQKIRALPE